MASIPSMYHPPLALTIVSSISIGFAGIAALWIALDIVARRGWKSMMAIMIPVYVVNALYLWPITLWTYLQYGRPPRLPRTANGNSASAGHDSSCAETKHAHCGQSSASYSRPDDNLEPAVDPDTGSRMQTEATATHSSQSHHHHHHASSERPMFATVTVAVCHCGAGCVIGDIIGEWLVYGTNATINGRPLWPAYLIDSALAIALGILFQYYSIAPMTGEYGPKTVYRAAKADILSLAFFEIGLFGWMAIFQIAIFQWKLEVNTVVYWWMMQIGMFIGHWTGVPINYWLISAGIKEACA